MARFRLSRLAELDLELILATSEERWGTEGMRRYATTLAAAMRKAAGDPKGQATKDRAALSPGLRSLHLRHVRGDDPTAKVRRPVHIIYYRMVEEDVIEIVRVLHERMDPSQHLGAA